MKNAKTIQTLASISLIGGPLSLIVGSVLLSTAGLVCGIIALVMVRSNKDATANAGMPDAIKQTLTRQAIIGIAVSAIASVMNTATVIMMMPAILDAVQTGDYSSLLAGGSSAADSAGSTDSSGAFGGNAGDAASEASQGGRSSVWG